MTTTPAAFKCDYPNCHCDHGALMACREAGFPGSPHAAAQKSGTTPAAPTTPEARRKLTMADALAWAKRHDLNGTDTELWCMFEDAATVRDAAPAEGQQPAEPPGQESGGSGSERHNAIIAKHFGNDVAGACKAQDVLREVLGASPALAQEGQQAVGQATQAVRNAQAGEGGTLTLSIRRSEWETLSPEAQKLIESRVLDRALLRRLALEHARGAGHLRDVPLGTAPAQAEASADMSADEVLDFCASWGRFKAEASADLSAAIRRAAACLQILNARPRPLCRDCADADGICPTTGLDCDMRKLIAALESAASLVRATPPDPNVGN